MKVVVTDVLAVPGKFSHLFAMVSAEAVVLAVCVDVSGGSVSTAQRSCTCSACHGWSEFIRTLVLLSLPLAQCCTFYHYQQHESNFARILTTKSIN